MEICGISTSLPLLPPIIPSCQLLIFFFFNMSTYFVIGFRLMLDTMPFSTCTRLCNNMTVDTLVRFSYFVCDGSIYIGKSNIRSLRH
jgi:hypothetical protein